MICLAGLQRLGCEQIAGCGCVWQPPTLNHHLMLLLLMMVMMIMMMCRTP